MILSLYQKISFILDRISAKANSTENRVGTSCDTAVLILRQKKKKKTHTKILEKTPLGHKFYESFHDISWT